MSVYVIYSEESVEVHATLSSLKKSLTKMIGIIAINHYHLSEVNWDDLDNELDNENAICHHIDLYSERVDKSYITKEDIINLDK